MVSGSPGNKRSFSHIEIAADASREHGLSAVPEQEVLDHSQRRVYVQENKVPTSPQNAVLISSKWYESFMMGEDGPVVLAKGAAGEKLDAAVFAKVESWVGLDGNGIAVRVGNAEEPDAPLAIRELDLHATLGEQLQLDDGHEVRAAKIYSRFLPSSDNVASYAPKRVSPSLKVGDLELGDAESLVVAPVRAQPLGRVGLVNMGNTCFMNSSLQALLHLPELVEFFASGQFRADLNRDNPIGCQGLVAEAFAELVRQTCDPAASPAVRPANFLRTIGRFHRSFASRMQQDSQEFTAFLLDSLHEDLNRIKNKPATEKPELADAVPATDETVAALAADSWAVHRRRNDSAIMDLFTGMYKSTLVCPVCGKVSITFDPFFDLTLPLPSSTIWTKRVFFVPAASAAAASAAGDRKLAQVEVALAPTGTVRQMKDQVAALLGLGPLSELVAADVYGSKIYRFLKDTESLADSIDQSDEIVLYETERPSAATEANVPVYLRVHGKAAGIPLLARVDKSSSASSIVAQIARSLARVGISLAGGADNDGNGDGDGDGDLDDSAAARDSAGADTAPENVASGLTLSYYSANFEDLTYGFAGRRPHALWPETADTLSEEDEHGEPFVQLRPEEPANEAAENLPTPAQSPDGALYSPSAADSDSSISPLSSETSPPGGPAPSVSSERAQADLEEPEGAGSSSSSGENNAAARAGASGAGARASAGAGAAKPAFDPHHMVLVADLAVALPDSLAEVAVEQPNPAAEAARTARTKTTTLEDCLRHFAQPEVLGEQDLWFCPRCRDFRQAQKQLELWKAPDVLMVHLKRFSGMHNLSRKINDLVEFPLEGLDIAKYTSPAARVGGAAQASELYDLVAVDNHYGGMGGGHYTSFVKDPFTGEWLDFNDSFVAPMSAGNVCTSAAYLLFYRRRGTSGRSQQVAQQVARALREGEYDQPAAAPGAEDGFLAKLPAPAALPASPNASSPSSDESIDAGAAGDSVFKGAGHVLGSSDGESGAQAHLPWANL